MGKAYKSWTISDELREAVKGEIPLRRDFPWLRSFLEQIDMT